MAINTYIYHLPFYFQAVKGTTAEGSAVRLLPYLATVSITAIATGGVDTAFGRYMPLMWVDSVILIAGCVLIQTFPSGHF